MQSNLEVVQKLYELVAAGNFDELRKILHPQIVGLEADGLPYKGRYEGKEAFIRLVMALGEHWESMSCTEFEYFAGINAESDAVIVVFRLQGTVRATGQNVDQRLSELWRVRDGQVIFMEPFYFDTHAIRKASGLA